MLRKLDAEKLMEAKKPDLRLEQVLQIKSYPVVVHSRDLVLWVQLRVLLDKRHRLLRKLSALTHN